MKISFTGHRDKTCAEQDLDAIRKMYPKAIWIHGGADGFDRQVQRYAENHGIETEIILPDYEEYPFKYAPLVRNKQIVDMGDLLIALWDGRQQGGTFYTINYAKRKNKRIIYLELPSHRNII